MDRSLVAQKIMTQAEDGGAFFALEDASLSLDHGLLNLASAGMKLVDLCHPQAFGGGKQDVHGARHCVGRLKGGDGLWTKDTQRGGCDYGHKHVV